MKNTISERNLSKVKSLLLFLTLGILLFAKVDLTFAVTKTTIATGLQAGVGIAIDDTNKHLYFIEYNAGTLKRLDYSSAPPYTIDVIASGFSHPEDVALDLDHGYAYVTTRDDPGTTGALWKVNITPGLALGTKKKIAFNLGAPQQLVLDIPSNQAYVVGYNDGRLRRINLITGAKTPIIKGLKHPVGLAITSDLKYAYVTEQGPPTRISQIDLTLGFKVSDDIATGLTAPFFLAWTDITQNSLYVAERIPADRVSRVNLITGDKNIVISGLPKAPSGIATSKTGTPVFVTTDKEIVACDMVELDGPVFMGVGHVPATEIDSNGYATTDPTYFFPVKHSPFGGTCNIFGNLVRFHEDLGATHYEVWVSKDGGAAKALIHSWNMYRWNITKKKYELVPIAPVPGTTKYEIPLETDGHYHSEFWYPPFLFMRWPSGDNGLYTFTVKIYEKSGATYNDLTSSIPASENDLKLRVDNTPPVARIVSIWQKGTPDKEIEPCDIVDSGLNQYYFKITAHDPNHHLLSYRLKALWGDNKSDPSIAIDSYSSHVDAEGPYFWSGITNTQVPTPYWEADCDCAHTFYLKVWKRTINGYNYILRRDYHKSITIANTPAGKCTP